MKTISKLSRDVVVQFTFEEIEIVINALNEVCNAFGHNEFQTRMGATVDEALLLLKDVNQLLLDK